MKLNKNTRATNRATSDIKTTSQTEQNLTGTYAALKMPGLDADGRIEDQLFHNLCEVKHKWPDQLSLQDIEQKYKFLPEVLGPGEQSEFERNYLTIDNSCENIQLFPSLIRLSGLLNLKYNFTKGKIVKVRIIVRQVFL